jgi:hypothetical protein
MSRKNFGKNKNSGAWALNLAALGIATPSNQMVIMGNSPFSQMCHSFRTNTAEQKEFMAYFDHVLCNKPLSFLIDKRGICPGPTDQQPPGREASASQLAYPFRPILEAP